MSDLVAVTVQASIASICLIGVQLKSSVVVSRERDKSRRVDAAWRRIDRVAVVGDL